MSHQDLVIFKRISKNSNKGVLAIKLTKIVEGQYSVNL